MLDTASDDSNVWASAIRQRNKATVQRMATGAATSLVFSPLLGWQFCVVWLGAYLAVQLAEQAVFAPVVRENVKKSQGWRGVAGDVLLVLNATMFAIVAVPLWLAGGPMGGVAASVLLSAGMMNSIILSGGSMRIFVCTVLPQMAIFAGTPIFMARYGAPPHIVVAASVAIVTYASFCLTTRRRLFRSNQAETEARTEANRKRGEAEAAMASRSAFLAAVAHDLRTPISAILTGAAELENATNPAARRQHVALIADAGQLMKDLLDDLLDHARLDAGRMEIESSDFDLRLLLSQTARLWQVPVRAKGLRLRLEGARMMPRIVRGDPMRLRQVLNNLISNAVKFTVTGAITLRLRSWSDEHGAQVLLFDVIDTGRGMKPEQMARLFTPFDQTANGVAAQFGGSGLGLAISRDLTELMGGRLTVRSEPGQGSIFTVSVTLPLGEAPTGIPASRGILRTAPTAAPTIDQMETGPVTAPQPVSRDDPEDGRPLRILVVDDHAINRRAIQLILQSIDTELTMAEDGMSALEICQSMAFDIIFMDVRMPELDGRETTRRLRAGGGLNFHVPVIAVTADSSPEDMTACEDAGMDYFVAKPLTPASLLGALSTVLAAQDAGAKDPRKHAAA